MGGVDQGLVKGLVFGGLHVPLVKFYSSLTHQKVVERVSNNNNKALKSLEVTILWWPNW